MRMWIKEQYDKKQNQWMALVSAVSMCLCLLPLLVISHFNYPCNDDFSYTGSIYQNIKEGASAFRIISDAVTEAITFYKIWQGRYFDDFVSAFGIGTAVPQYYFIGTYIVLIIFVLSSIYFLKSVFDKVCMFEKKISYTAGLWIVIFQILYVPYPVEAFYWYVGATGYTMTYGLMLALIATIINYYSSTAKNDKIRYAILAGVLVVCVGGSNYATALLTLELLVCGIGILLLQKKNALFLGSVLIEYIIAFGFNALSPGNANRLSNVDSLGIAGSITASIERAALFCKEWFRAPVAILLVFIFLITYQGIAKMPFRFRYPILVTMVSFGLFASILTPPFYAGATWGPGRLINILYYCYYLLLAGNLMYWYGWISHRFSAVSNWQFGMPNLIYTLGLLVGLTLCLKIYGLQSTSSTSALLSLVKGEAEVYRIENEIRWEIYEDESQEEMVVQEFSVKPHVLYHDDIVEDMDDWRNWTVANYFGKKSVKLEKNDE